MPDASNRDQKYGFLRLVPLLCIGVLLLATFRLYGYAYFWLDDFNNLHWVRDRTFPEAIGLVLSPSAAHFRPTGMLVYQIAGVLFGRDPKPYHWLMWAIHAFNVGLVYIVLKRLTLSRAGAAVGALFFAYPPVFNDLFWSFGTIFELTGAALFFTGMLVWHQQKRNLGVVLLATAVFILALKAKEMAITLPAVWILQDLLLRRPLRWKELVAVVFPGIVGAWFGFQRLVLMQAPEPAQPYYMDLRGITMGRGFAHYFNALLGTNWRWQYWCIGFVALLLVFALLRWRRVFFFQAYIFVTFLPIIFLINHRDPFYWYFPMLGICGILAMLTRSITDWLAPKIPERRLALSASISFALLSLSVYAWSCDTMRERREWQAGIGREYRGFVESLQALPTPNPGETLYFKSIPEHFDADTLLFASEFALQIPGVYAQIVEDFPPGARYRLVFENSRVIMQGQ